MPRERLFTTTGKEYEYRSLLASEWDLMRPGAEEWPDIPFYRELILDNGEPALDVACATGRLVLTYMAEGLDVDAIDVSPEMLEICRAKARERGLEPPRLYLQGMEALDLPRQYRTIIVSSGSFGLLTDPADARRALAGFHRHLEPGGKLVMSLILFHPEEAKREKEWVLEGEETRPADGALVRCWNRVTTSDDGRLQHTEDRWEVLVDGEVVETEHHSRSALHGYRPDEAVSIVEAAGFADVQKRGGFANHPVFSSDHGFIVLGTRP